MCSMRRLSRSLRTSSTVTMSDVRRLRCRWPFDTWTCSCCGLELDDCAPSSVLAGLVCDRCLDSGRHGEPFIALTVRPTKPVAALDDRVIVAVSMRHETTLIEGGEVTDLEGLVERVRERRPGEVGGLPNGLKHRYRPPDRLPAAIVVTDDALDLLGYLEHSAANDGRFWQWQVSVRASSAWRPEVNARRPRAFLTARPLRFGYPARGRDGERKKASIWWLLIDPRGFCERPDLGGQMLSPADLLRFGIELRDWSNAQRLPVLSGVSSYGSRLLRDSRFGEDWRRKVPASTNRRIRRRLPGNHYQLVDEPGVLYPRAHKWDQAAAHHHAALKCTFPHADELDARGWFRRDAPASGSRMSSRGAIRAGSREWHRLLEQPGLFTIAVRVPEMVAIDELTIPPLRRAGASWQTLTHVELEHARKVGCRPLDIWCCWTSPGEDDRMREYALWAGGKLEQADAGTRPWVKPLLLAAYGMLAVRPSRFRNGWSWCHNPDGAIGWQTRYGELVGVERAGRRDREPQTANVLWRAIIESAVRLESLTFAQSLRAAGLRPVSIYADAVFATDRPRASGPVFDQREARLAPPWRYEGAVHDLMFESSARYRSLEEARRPGVPRIRTFSL